MNKEMDQMSKQIEIYEVNLKLVSGKDATAYKAYLGKAKRDIFDLQTGIKGLEQDAKSSKKNKDQNPESDLFGKAAQKEQEEQKINLGELESIFNKKMIVKIARQVIQMGHDYQKKTEDVVINIGKTVKQTNIVADNIIVFYKNLNIID